MQLLPDQGKQAKHGFTYQAAFFIFEFLKTRHLGKYKKTAVTIAFFINSIKKTL